MMATGDVPDVDMPPPLAEVGVAEAHDQEGGEEEEPAIDECIDIDLEEEDSQRILTSKVKAIAQAPRPDNTFGSPFALQ